MYLNFFFVFSATPYSAPTPRLNYPPMSGIFIGFWAIVKTPPKTHKAFVKPFFGLDIELTH